MTKFRDNDIVKKRLAAFFNTALAKPRERNDGKLFKTVFLQQDEFFVIIYPFAKSILIVTSRRLIIRGCANIEFSFDDIVGISLERNFKHDNTPKWLNIFTRMQLCYVITFDDLEELIEARNVVFRVINTAVESWEGSSFRINEDALDLKYEKIII